MCRSFVVFLAMIVFPGWMIVQDNHSCEFRHRIEYVKTLLDDDAKAAFQISQRSRLNSDHRRGRFNAGSMAQIIRFWDATPQFLTSNSRIMLHLAWAEWNFAEGFLMGVGRRKLNYNDAHILGNMEWAQHARAHDLALLKYGKNLKPHLGLVSNQSADRLTGTRYALSGSY